MESEPYLDPKAVLIHSKLITGLLDFIDPINLMGLYCTDSVTEYQGAQGWGLCSDQTCHTLSVLITTF